MKSNRRLRSAWIGALLAGMLCACGIFSGGSSPSSSSSGNTSSGVPQNFPLTPNPVNVQITVDKAHTVNDKMWVEPGTIAGSELSGTDSKGTTFSFMIPEALLTQEADGTIDPAFGTAVSVAPVTSIDGFPFSKGFLAAFQFGPEGVLYAQPGLAELTIQGSYKDLVGFASNGDGTDFHLIPIDAFSSGGTTSVNFNIMHYSMYGVAEATQSEITAQQSHPPSTSEDQDDDLLAAPSSKSQTQLQKSHDRLLNALLANLNACNTVVKASRLFMKWYGNVQAAGEQNYFKDTINSNAGTLLSRLKDCLQIACPLCLQNKKPDKKSASALLVQAYYLEAFDMLLGKTDEANFYRDLASKCAKAAGLPDPTRHVAECTDNCPKVTPTVIDCPTQ